MIPQSMIAIHRFKYNTQQMEMLQTLMKSLVALFVLAQSKML